MSDFKVVDAPPCLRGGGNSRGRWAELVIALDTLPDGKWVEITPRAGESLARLQINLNGNLRRRFPIHTRKHDGKLYITRDRNGKGGAA